MGGRGASSGIGRGASALALAAFPTLTGSQKQISWATNIRDAFRASVDAALDAKQKTLARQIARGKTDLADRAKREINAIIAVHNWAIQNSNAAFWINYRNAFQHGVGGVALLPHHMADVAEYLRRYGLDVQDAL